MKYFREILFPSLLMLIAAASLLADESMFSGAPLATIDLGSGAGGIPAVTIPLWPAASSVA